ncbi:hypothetical protein C8Q74DRAFT_415656 [Fomes fomentarius]|nr:hypothetical protein C8Q74DRAFT_415656 [Fomes fomentarius]
MQTRGQIRQCRQKSSIASSRQVVFKPVHLPTELLMLINSHLCESDLPAFVLTSRTCNLIGTPRLYRTILPKSSRGAALCVRTLTSPPETTSFQRDLAAMVHSFALEGDAKRGPLPGGVREFAHNLAHAAMAMSNLRTISLHLFPPTKFVLHALLKTPHPSLKSIQLDITKESRKLYVGSSRVGMNSEEPFPPLGAKLPQSMSTTIQAHTLKLQVEEDLANSEMNLLKELLRQSAATLRSLSLPGLDSSSFARIFAISPAFEMPVLEELVVSPPEMLCLFRNISNLRRLSTLRYETALPRNNRRLEYPREAWPRLEELACRPSELRAFLPDHTASRPVHKYTTTEWYGREAVPIPGPLSDLQFTSAFRYLQFSAVPIRDLRFALMKLDIGRLARLVRAHPHLEILLISVSRDVNEETLRAVGQEVLVHAPRLQMFLLSDQCSKIRGRLFHPFKIAGDLDLQRRLLAEYDKCTPVLRRVAFTADFDWEKHEDVWRQTAPVELD